MIDVTGVNWLAIIVSAAASFIIGGLWYGLLFSKPWMRYTGITAEAASAGGGGGMAFTYVIAFLTYLVAVIILALVIQAAGAAGALEGLVFGLLVGVGIVAAVSYNNYMFSGRPFGLYLIDNGYPVVALAVSGVILGVWQ